MAKTKSNQAEEQEEKFYENPEVLEGQIDQAEEFLTNNRNVLVGILVAIAVLVGGYFFYQNYQKQQNADAERELFPAVFFFEKDSLNQALNGDGSTTIGLEAITRDYSGTKAANLAHFYAGAAQFELGEYDAAIEHLEAFSAEDYLLGARAYALIGDAYVQKEAYADAVAAYQKAIDKYPNAQFTPVYLHKLALAQEKQGKLAEAQAAYERIVNEFRESDLLNLARKHAERLRVMQ